MLMASASRSAGGVFEAVRHLSGNLRAHAPINIHVVGLEDEAFNDDRHLWGSIPVSAVPVIGPRSFGFAPHLSRRLLDAAPEVLHVHGLWMYTSLAALRWSRKTKRPLVVSPHGMLDRWALRNSRIKKRIAALLFERAHLTSAAVVHALCESEANAIRDYGLRNPICIIPNGVELPEQGESAPAPWHEAVPSADRVLLYLGRLHPKKNLRPLLQAWAATPKKGWQLVIAGWDQNGHEHELRTEVAQAGASDSIHFIGPQFGAAKAAAFQNCDAFILPSLSEGLPMVVLEAWAHAKPVLMTAECNLPLGFSSGSALRIGSDQAALRAGLRELFSQSQAQLALTGFNGLELVKQHFTWKIISRQMADVYRWISKGGGRPESIQC